MTDLSPQAQAVLDAAYEAWITRDDSRSIAAAALRAAADQVVPNASPRDRASWSPFASQIRAELLAIATELEADR
jgi:hypothetical protein